MKKKAIIIGATSGIGRELALLLAKKNFQVGATGRRKELLETLQLESPENIIISDFDVTHTFEVSKKVEELVGLLGGLDVLIMSSGVGKLNKELDFNIEKQTIDVNVLGFTEVADWAYNFFEQQKFGHFAAITSIAGLRGSRHAPSYYASKAFQISYLEGLRQKAEKTKLPIYITDIRPGFVDTDMAQGDGKFWVATVKKASYQIFKAIERKKTIVYVTKRWSFVAALLKNLPDLLYKKF